MRAHFSPPRANYPSTISALATMTQRADVQLALKRYLDLADAATAAGEVAATLCLLFDAEQLWADARLYDSVAKKASAAYFVNVDLLHPSDAPLEKILEGRNDMAYYHLVHLDVPTFDYLYSFVDQDRAAQLEGYTDYTRSERRPGPPNRLNARTHLALALMWLTTTCGQKEFQMSVGAGPAVLSRSLDIGLALLMGALAHAPEAKILWPTKNQQRRFADIIEARYGPPPAVFRNNTRIFGLIDGTHLLLQNFSDVEKQQFWYSGYVTKESMNNVLVWTPDGKCIAAVVGVQGNMHDSRASQVIYADLHNKDWTTPGNVLCGDSGFASSYSKAIVATESYQPPGVVVSAADRAALETWRLKIRKGAEFGINTWKRMCPRITVPMSTDISWNIKVLGASIRLTNLAAARMNNHNQLKAMYFDQMMRAPFQI